MKNLIFFETVRYIEHFAIIRMYRRDFIYLLSLYIVLYTRLGALNVNWNGPKQDWLAVVRHLLGTEEEDMP